MGWGTTTKNYKKRNNIYLYPKKQTLTHLKKTHLISSLPRKTIPSLPLSRKIKISEYMRYAHFCAVSENMKISTQNTKRFKINLNKEATSAKFTFRSIPIQSIRKVMKERLNLVIDPNKRERRIREYYSSP